MCTLGFEGKGYSPGFVDNYAAIAAKLSGPAGEDTPIQVTLEADAICEPCPNRTGKGCVSSQKIRALDDAHQEMLGLADGEVLSWAEAKKRIADRVSLEKFDQACAPCSWKSLGVCEKALRRLKDQPKRFGALGWIVGFVLAASPCIEAVAARKPSPKATSLQLLVKGKGLEMIGAQDPFFDHAQALLAAKSFREAESAFAQKKWTRAGSLAQAAVSHWGKIPLHSSGGPWLKRLPDELGRVELLQARLSAHQKRDKEARILFERAFDRMALPLVGWPDLDAYLKVCGDWEKRDSVDSCALWVRKILGVFPKESPERKELELRWSKALDWVDRIPLAPPAGRIQQNYKQPDLDQLSWEEILPKIREHKLRSIRSDLEGFLEKFPRSGLRQKVRYWLALSLLEGGPDSRGLSLLDQVMKESPLSFYGLLAARQLNRDPESVLSSEAPQEQKRDNHLHPGELGALEKAEQLISAGLFELAQMELREIRVRESLESPFLVYLARLHQEAGSHLGAFLVVTELIQRGDKAAATRWASDLVFPIEQWTLIDSASRERGIDPLWVLGLIKQESGFDSGALSSTGAVGLMQIMPATAVEVDSTVYRLELSAHERNIRIGTGYMAYLLKRFRGNLALATAGYNAGPVAVDRWLREFKELGPRLGLVEFIESIPYKETRDYVGSIIRNYFWYSKRLRPEASRPTGLTPVLVPSPSPGVSPDPAAAPRNELEYFWKALTPQSGSA